MARSFFRGKRQVTNGTSRRNRRNGQVPGRRRPRFEQLEQRHLLATLTVDSLADNMTPNDNLVTLREAIIAANTDATTDDGDIGSGADTIDFAPALFPSPQTITLTLGELPITESVTITGPGRDTLTLAAGLDARIFNIAAEAGDVTIQGVTLSGGNPAAGLTGGAVLSKALGMLTIVDSAITGNTANEFGGGVYATGDVTVKGTLIGVRRSPGK